MISNYDREDEFKIRRAKRSKAGSLKPSIKFPRKGGKGFKPQAMVKVAGWANTSSSVKRMLDYISRTKEKETVKGVVALETEMGTQKRGASKITELYDQWKADFKRKSKTATRAPRHAAHLVFSAYAELTPRNVEKTLLAARRTLTRHIGDKGYKFALGVHQDGKYPHVHAVVKTDSTIKKQPKLRLGPQVLFEIRKTLAKELTREGLTHVATREKRKMRQRPSNYKTSAPNVLERTKKTISKLKREHRRFERALKRESPRINALKHREQQSKALDTLRAQVKEDKLLADKERKEAFDLIRSFRRHLARKGVDKNLETKATLSDLISRIDKWEKDVIIFQRGIARKGNSFGQNLSEKNNREQLHERGGKLLHQVDSFVSQLKQLDMPVHRKKEIFRELRVKYLGVKKSRSLALERGR